MNSALNALKSNDLIKSAINAVGIAVVLSIGSAVSQQGFDFFAADWGAILHNVVNVGFTAFFVDLVRRYKTDSEGKLSTPFGKIG